MNYLANQLQGTLEDLHRKLFTGIARLAFQVEDASETFVRVLAFRDGALTYAGLDIPDNTALAQQLAAQLQRSMIVTASSFAFNKMTDKESARELATMLVKLRVLTWEELTATCQTQVAIVLEQALPHGGRIDLDESRTFDLAYGEDAGGLDWQTLNDQIKQRQQSWQELVPTVPSMWAIPEIPIDAGRQISDLKVRQHILKWADGKRSLVAIARETHRDPLELAQSYRHWAEAGWIQFAGANVAQSGEAERSLPVILSVDDSPIVQTLIKRSLAGSYQVLLAKNAIEALNILNREQVQLLLLDVTMPVIDGLEFCKTLRKIPRFTRLPVVMLTAREGNINKMKGQIAGTNRYLTKPVNREELLRVVGEYVK